MKRFNLVPAAALIAAIALPGSALSQPSGGMPQRGMMAPGLFMPRMDPQEGRRLFAEKACVVCHSINWIGGEDAPALDSATMAVPMDPFEFAAKMWRGAPAMIAMQEDELGTQIELSGQELADIIAFVHDPAEQKKFSEDDIPDNIRELMEEDH